MKQTELMLVIGLLAMSAALVSGSVQLPSSVVLLLASPIIKLLLVLSVIYAFVKCPTVGIAATVAVAVLLFSRNIALVTSWTAPPPDSYPTDQARPEGIPETRSYSFRPAADTGSDEFTRFGPSMDEKIEVLR